MNDIEILVGKLSKENLDSLIKKFGICSICKNFDGKIIYNKAEITEETEEIQLQGISVESYACKEISLAMKTKVVCAQKNLYLHGINA